MSEQEQREKTAALISPVARAVDTEIRRLTALVDHNAAACERMMLPGKPWHMYPPPGAPSNPATWEDIERLALHYPAAREAVVMVERGDWTREEALVRLVYALADAFQKLFSAEVDRRRREPMVPLVIPKDPQP